MKKILKNKKAFTLVEVMVAVSIFSVIMLSVMGIYIVSTETTYKSEVNRIVHENVKNIVTNISEDVMKNNIIGVSGSITVDCSLPTELTNENKKGFKFCMEDKDKNEIIYTLATRNNSGIFLSIDSLTKCLNEDCFLIKVQDGKTNPVTNSLITVKNVNFLVTNNGAKKVTISLKLEPSKNSGVRKSVIEQNVFDFQTTISSRK